RRERLDLARIVRHCAEDRRGVLGACGLTLHLELPETPAWILGDPTRLAQVLGNVLDNAAKFTPAGGRVTVLLKSDDRTRQAVVTVRDTGIGIDPAILPHIFEVFAQADCSLERTRGGLGLGLSVAKGLVELHGGSIAAVSEGSGQGAEFTIRLPGEPELPALAAPVSATPGNKHFRILVVEDNRDAAE